MQQPPDGNEEQTSCVSFVDLVYYHNGKFCFYKQSLQV